MKEVEIRRLDALALQWMELVVAGQGHSAEAQALAARFAALDRLNETGQQAANAAAGAGLHGTRLGRVASPATAEKAIAEPGHPAPRHTPPRPRLPLAGRPGRKQVLSDFQRGQLAALLAVGTPLRVAARWLQISRSTAQRARTESLQAAAASLAEQILREDCLKSGPFSPE